MMLPGKVRITNHTATGNAIQGRIDRFLDLCITNPSGNFRRIDGTGRSSDSGMHSQDLPASLVSNVPRPNLLHP